MAFIAHRFKKLNYLGMEIVLIFVERSCYNEGLILVRLTLTLCISSNQGGKKCLLNII